MDAAYNLAFPIASVEALQSKKLKRSLHLRSRLEMISTGISLLTLSAGFSLFGLLIILNQHQADLNESAGGRSLVTLGGIASILVGTAFLAAAILHWKPIVRKTLNSPIQLSAA